MITGPRNPTRRTVANKPVPTPSLNQANAAALRSAFGPGFQLGASDRIVRQAMHR